MVLADSYQLSANYVSKTGIAIEETDESLYWMELLIDATIIAENRLSDLMKEAAELVAILIASVKTARQSIVKEKSS